MAIRNARTLLGVPRLLRVSLGSRSSLKSLINLAANCAGARSAGNPHATCDVAGAGNGATATPNRARRGKPRIQAKDEPTGYRASARPYQWSPDGQSIAFLRPLSRDRDGVFLVPAIGGTARKLVEIYPTGLDDCYAWHPDWHPGGRWLLIVDKDSAERPFSLFLVSVETGERRKLTSPPPHFVGDQYAAFSPDGRTIALVRSTNNEHVSDLYLLKLSDGLTLKGELTRISFENFYIGSPAWTPDGRAIVFSGGDFHNPSLWKIALGGSVAAPDLIA